MTRTPPAFDRIISTLVLLGLSCCVTTPLPVPPTIDPERVTITDDSESGGVLVEGSAGAVDPVDQELRITYGGEPIDSMPPLFDEVETAADGSFSAHVRGTVTSRFFIEAITDDEDLFLVAITVGSRGPSEETDPGPDSDGDGSPDEIDCAPLDDTQGGQRCGD